MNYKVFSFYLDKESDRLLIKYNGYDINRFSVEYNNYSSNYSFPMSILENNKVVHFVFSDGDKVSALDIYLDLDILFVECKKYEICYSCSMSLLEDNETIYFSLFTDRQ